VPEGLAPAVDAAVAASMAGDDPKSRKRAMSALDTRLERLRETYELGDITRDDYLTRWKDYVRVVPAESEGTY
jgi:hypothetical protein